MAQAQLAEDAGLQLPDDWEAQLDARLAAAGVEHEGEPDPEFPLHEVRTYRLVDLETAAQVGERLAARQARLARLAAGEGEQVDLVSEGEEGGVGVGGGAAAGAAASVARPARFAYGTPPALDADERAELLRMYMEEEVEGVEESDAGSGGGCAAFGEGGSGVGVEVGGGAAGEGVSGVGVGGMTFAQRREAKRARIAAKRAARLAAQAARLAKKAKKVKKGKRSLLSQKRRASGAGPSAGVRL